MTRLLASWFGSGLILGRVRGSDVGSGTVGALLAGVISYLIGAGPGPWGQALLAIIVTGSALAVCDRLAAEHGDAGWIVIDEAAGATLALIGLTALPAAVAAFIAFRAADIFKKWFPGVAEMERRAGGLGIVGDDVVAGLYGLAAGHLIQALI